MGGIMKFANKAFDRAFSGLISWQLWLFALVTHLVVDLALLGSEAVVEQEDFYTALGLAALVAVIVAQWKFTRAFGEAPPEQHGSVGAWFGWTVVAFIPAVIILIAVIWYLGVDAIEDPPATRSIMIGMAAVVALLSPVLVHASGRAINANGPSLTECFRGCQQFFFPLALGYFVISAGCWALGDWLLTFVEPSLVDPVAVGLSIGSALCYFVAFFWTTSLLTLAWLRIDKSRLATS